ncbi:hypothetical protein C8T65DRAFT_585203 [Cerioporus squamosus]|nr:hypothetical protein C8T65DRAFT_585203 [Cerioporus squamosus]
MSKISGYGGKLPNIEVCFFCMRKASRLETPLKKCSGCSIAKYCSKECQKSAWPAHKSMCRSSRSATGAKHDEDLCGFPTSMALSSSMKEWSQIHEYTFYVITNMLANAAAGSVDHTFGAPRVLVISMEAHPGALDCSPAFAFCINSAEIICWDDSPVVCHHWDMLMDGCKRELVFVHRQDPTSPWAGVLPTIFFAPSKPLVIMLTQYPIYRFQHESLHRNPLDSRMQVALNDHVHMCMESMSLGHIYVRPSMVGDPEWYEPVVMQMVRLTKHWKHVPIQGDDDYWDTMAGIMAGPPKRFTSGLHPHALWANFIHACFGISGGGGEPYLLLIRGSPNN